MGPTILITNFSGIGVFLIEYPYNKEIWAPADTPPIAIPNLLVLICNFTSCYLIFSIHAVISSKILYIL